MRQTSWHTRLRTINRIQDDQKGLDIKKILEDTQTLNTAEERKLQWFSAVKLFPIFQKSRETWHLLPYFGKASNPQMNFQKLHELVPGELKDIVSCISKTIYE